MAGIVPWAEQKRQLEYKVNKAGTAGRNLTVLLFTNNLTPTEATVFGDLTVKTGDGCDPIELAGASWAITDGAGPTPTLATFAEQTWSPTANVTIYGYALVRFHGTTNEIVHIQRDDNAPRAYVGNVDDITITPRVEEDSQ